MRCHFPDTQAPSSGLTSRRFASLSFGRHLLRSSVRNSADVAPASGWLRARGVAIVVLALLLVAPSAQRSRAFVGLPVGEALDPKGATERYALPITPPIDQQNSDLCWVFATLSMLETNYMVRHPGSQIVLSRAALQLDRIADRFRHRIRGEPTTLEEGGLAVEALALIRRNGLFEEADFHDVVDSDAVFASIDDRLGRYASPLEKEKALDAELAANLGVTPGVTHLGRIATSPKQMARAFLGDEQWTEFDLSRDGYEGWGPSHDPDALPETRVRYVRLEAMIDLVHRSLRAGEAVVAGSIDHAVLIYGGDYDRDGRPVSYLIKDSLAPYLYRTDAETLHRGLNDVTVALPESTIQLVAQHSSEPVQPPRDFETATTLEAVFGAPQASSREPR
jgi:hypothetical protein